MSWTHSDTQCFGKGDGWKMIHKSFSDVWPHPCNQLVAAGHCSYAIPLLKGLGMVILMAVAKTLRNPYLWQKIWQFLQALMNWIGDFNSVHNNCTAPSTSIYPCDREPDEALVSLDVSATSSTGIQGPFTPIPVNESGMYFWRWIAFFCFPTCISDLHQYRRNTFNKRVNHRHLDTHRYTTGFNYFQVKLKSTLTHALS